MAEASTTVNVSTPEPGLGLAVPMKWRALVVQSDKENPRRVGEADFFSRYALKWSPDDAEVKKLREEIVAQIEALKKP